MPRLADRLRVYVVTSDAGPGRTHLDIVRAAVEGGATAVQLRAPELKERHDDLVELAREACHLCSEAGVLFIVDDDLEAAQAAGADGVHVGPTDEPNRVAANLPPGLLLGMSVDGPEDARMAERLGAAYLGITVWQTPTKPEASPHGPDGVREVCGATSLPVVGIGGIHAENAGEVVLAGAAGVAVISAVAGDPDPTEAVRRLDRAVRAALADVG